jgi:GNAT superfamily N-acetyltransferase
LEDQSAHWRSIIANDAGPRDKIAELSRFYVRPEYRKSGVAFRLAFGLVKQMLQDGYTTVYAPGKLNSRLIDLYHFWGVVPVSSESIPFVVNGIVRGEYALLRCDYGEVRTWRRAVVMMKLRVLEVLNAHIFSLYRLFKWSSSARDGLEKARLKSMR